MGGCPGNVDLSVSRRSANHGILVCYRDKLTLIAGQLTSSHHPDGICFLKIATYNVNGVNGRLANLLRWLADEQPDVVCLQELKAPDDRFPIAAIRESGYDAVWHGQKSWNGVAILSRGEDPKLIRRGLPGERKAGRMPSASCIPTSAYILFGSIGGTPSRATRVCASTTCCSMRQQQSGWWPPASIGT